MNRGRAVMQDEGLLQVEMHMPMMKMTICSARWKTKILMDMLIILILMSQRELGGGLDSEFMEYGLC
jgi:hypothetical protein